VNLGLLKKGERLYLDVEMLKMTGDTKHRMVAGDVAIVNKKREIVLWATIKRDENKICQLFPHMTGFTKTKILSGFTIEFVSLGLIINFFMKTRFSF